jgi:hypothetical protein
MGAPATLPANFNGWDAPQGSAPPASLPANFSAWDQPKASAQPAKKDYTTPAGAAEEVADMLGGAVKSLAKVSGPNVMYELLRKNFPSLGLKPVLGMPTANEVGAQGAAMMIPGAEGEAGEGVAVPKAEPAIGTAAKVGAALEHPAVTPWIGMMKRELMKIPGTDLAKTTYESLRGLAEGTPEAPKAPTPTAPPAAIPETNGVPWGSGGQGPLDLRGKMIPQEAAPAAASEPAPQPTPSDIPKRADVSVWRDATRQNVPYAGEDYGKLQAATKATIDKAIPAEGDTLALNKRVTSQVETHLSQGNVEAAESVLDTAAVKANPKWTPPSRPRIVPSTQNIRETIAQVNDAEAAPNRPTPDSMEDRALSQEMSQDLERHGWAAESEARREFIARNSTGVTKSDLTGAAEKPVKYTKTPAVPSPGTSADDLTDLLQKSLEAAKRAKEQH